MIKVSIVIPTMKLDLLRKCLASIVEHTNLTDLEILVVANGAPDEMQEYLRSTAKFVPLRWLWYKEPLGPVPALNKGIEMAIGEYVVLLNDDCEILSSEKNAWINMLRKPLDEDPAVAVTGPLKMINLLGVAGAIPLAPDDAAYGFIVFFCAMIRREMFTKIGMLDEALKCGVDLDFCMKAKRQGYKIMQVPTEKMLEATSPTHLCGEFPIWHQAEGTVHDFYGLEEWHRITKADAKILTERWGEKKPNEKTSIIIPTFGDSLEVLKKCIDSVIDHTKDLSSIHIMVVANGCKENVHEYLITRTNLADELLMKGFLNFIWFDKPMGFPEAANAGIKATSGDIVVFLNHDVVILGSDWLDMLRAPFADPTVGLTGPLKGWDSDLKRHFIMFFCAAIRRTVFNDIGMIDTIFSPGGFEDIDFGIHAENAGWKLVQVPESVPTTQADVGFSGGFPIYHVEHHNLWMDSELYQRNRKITLDRYQTKDMHQAEMFVNPVDFNLIIVPDWPAAQKKYELLMIQEFLKSCKIRTVLEIGTYRGGTTMLWAKMVERHGGHVYCVDVNFDFGAFDDGGKHYERQVYNGTPQENLITEIKGDSHDPEIIASINEDIGGLVDLLFIDGDHSYEGVKRDFETYFPFVKQGGHVVFHDITESDYHKSYGCYVSTFWKEIKDKYPTWEFVDNNDYAGAPHHSMGIGILRKSEQAGEAAKPSVFSDKPRVLCFIATKNRYHTTLPLAIQSVISQTVKPEKLLIYDDNADAERIDLRENIIYRHLFRQLTQAKIEWEVQFGAKRGQHFGHQAANTRGFEFVWRIDDDEVAEPTVLEKLISHTNDSIGAVGGAVIIEDQNETGGSPLLEHIFSRPNIQWAVGKGIIEADHLHSSFLYRAGIVEYDLNLSPVAHREETIFTHELKRKGYRVIVDPSAVTHHLKQPSGGIRSNDSAWLYEHDEKIFLSKLEQWGYKIIVLNSGLGDHCAFANLLPELQERYPHLILSVCYNDVFEGKLRTGDTLISIAQAPMGAEENIYKWMGDHNWKGALVDAYRKIYLG